MSLPRRDIAEFVKPLYWFSNASRGAALKTVCAPVLHAMRRAEKRAYACCCCGAEQPFVVGGASPLVRVAPALHIYTPYRGGERIEADRNRNSIGVRVDEPPPFPLTVV